MAWSLNTLVKFGTLFLSVLSLKCISKILISSLFHCYLGPVLLKKSGGKEVAAGVPPIDLRCSEIAIRDLAKIQEKPRRPAEANASAAT